MRKLLALAIMAAVVWFAYLKPKQEEEQAQADIGPIDSHLATLRTEAAKLQYLEQCRAEATTDAMRTLIDARIAGITDGNATGLDTEATTGTGVLFTLTTAEMAEVQSACSAIHADMRGKNGNRSPGRNASHYDNQAAYNAAAYTWPDKMVYHLLLLYDETYGHDLYEDARQANWVFGRIGRKTRDTMKRIGDAFVARLKQVKQQYGL